MITTLHKFLSFITTMFRKQKRKRTQRHINKFPSIKKKGKINGMSREKIEEIGNSIKIQSNIEIVEFYNV